MAKPPQRPAIAQRARRLAAQVLRPLWRLRHRADGRPNIGASANGRIRPDSPWVSWHRFDALQTDPERQYTGWGSQPDEALHARLRQMTAMRQAHPVLRQGTLLAPLVLDTPRARVPVWQR